MTVLVGSTGNVAPRSGFALLTVLKRIEVEASYGWPAAWVYGSPAGFAVTCASNASIPKPGSAASMFVGSTVVVVGAPPPLTSKVLVSTPEAEGSTSVVMVTFVKRAWAGSSMLCGSWVPVFVHVTVEAPTTSEVQSQTDVSGKRDADAAVRPGGSVT